MACDYLATRTWFAARLISVANVTFVHGWSDGSQNHGMHSTMSASAREESAGAAAKARRNAATFSASDEVARNLGYIKPPRGTVDLPLRCIAPERVTSRSGGKPPVSGGDGQISSHRLGNSLGLLSC